MSARTYEEGKLRYWVILHLIAMGAAAASLLVMEDWEAPFKGDFIYFILGYLAWTCVTAWRVLVWWRRVELDRYLGKAFREMRERDEE